jgi:hypothetical protein
VWKRSGDLGGLMPTFITIRRGSRAATYGPFWSRRSRRRWIHELEETQLGTCLEVQPAPWRPRRSIHR